MIRKFKENDIDSLMEIWLNTNIQAHYFIDSNYWNDNFQMVKKLIPQAEVYLYEINRKIVGFVGITENYIAGIFVAKDYQSQGIGKELLEFIKKKYSHLSLNVYKRNVRAIDFYLKSNFKILSEQIDTNVKEKELYMKWKRN